MDLVKHLQVHNPCLSLSSDSIFQRRTIQTVALVSILSGMLLSLFSPLLVPLCFHSFESFSFSAYFMELQPLSYAANKNYMFLLCNGILVILFGSSGLIETGRSGIASLGPRTARNDPRLDGHGRDFSNELTEERGTADAEEKLPVAVNGDFLIQKDEIQEQVSELAIAVASHDDDEEDEIEDESSRDKWLITEQAMQEQPSELWMIIDQAVIDDKGDGDDVEAHGELSIDELNRRCDEFIKKMRGELDVENLVAP